MKELTTAEVEKMRRDEQIEIIDVREAFEVALGTIPGATHIPLGQIEARLDHFKRDKTYVIICRSGNRSGVVTQYLEACGIDAYNMIGGMIDWQGTME
ncbi:MAG TPA: rhodanese-like domain-containing protein [Pseudogracilibacillus sp.]|nr:rhodanese-like domain-containing protein [Pseudogracilibacillus sp.]